MLHGGPCLPLFVLPLQPAETGRGRLRTLTAVFGDRAAHVIRLLPPPPAADGCPPVPPKSLTAIFGDNATPGGRAAPPAPAGCGRPAQPQCPSRPIRG